MDLRSYPFDIDDVDIILNSLQFDSYGYIGSSLTFKLTPYECGNCCILFMPLFNPNSGGLLEWEMTKLSTTNCLVGKQPNWAQWWQLEFHIQIRRNILPCMLKIVLPLFLASLMSFSPLQWDPVEDGKDRMDFSVNMFLATSAFLYLIDGETPNTPYLKCMDKITVLSVLVTVLVAIESMIVRHLAVREWLSSDSVKMVDTVMGMIIMATFLCGFLGCLAIDWVSFLWETHVPRDITGQSLRQLMDSQYIYTKDENAVVERIVLGGERVTEKDHLPSKQANKVQSDSITENIATTFAHAKSLVAWASKKKEQ